MEAGRSGAVQCSDGQSPKEGRYINYEVLTKTVSVRLMNYIHDNK